MTERYPNSPGQYVDVGVDQPSEAAMRDKWIDNEVIRLAAEFMRHVSHDGEDFCVAQPALDALREAFARALDAQKEKDAKIIEKEIALLKSLRTVVEGNFSTREVSSIKIETLLKVAAAIRSAR